MKFVYKLVFVSTIVSVLTLGLSGCPTEQEEGPPDAPWGLDFDYFNGRHALSWQSVEGAVKYIIEWTDDRSFYTTSGAESYSSPYIFSPKLSIGQIYYFRVRTIGARELSEWSRVRMERIAQ
jgi:hypothetical protein